MQYSSQPGKFPLAFAGTGNKRTVPENSLIGTNPGYASLADGFPPLCATPLVAGGIPPDILDMNGILNQATAVSRWSNAGAGYTYDSAFATDTNVAGYPKGAVLLRSDGSGYWLNTVDNNVANPDTGGAGWVPYLVYGSYSQALSNAAVTLTASQAAYPVIILTGTLTANITLTFPQWIKNWFVVNNCTGAFQVTCTSGTGNNVLIGNGAYQIMFDGTNMRQLGRGSLSNSNLTAFTPTLSNTYTKTFSFTAPCNGSVIACQILNIGATTTPSVSFTNSVSISGGSSASDTSIYPMSDIAISSVIGGATVSITGTLTSGASGTLTNVSTNLYYIFVPA